jgi:hypothetical protein
VLTCWRSRWWTGHGRLKTSLRVQILKFQMRSQIFSSLSWKSTPRRPFNPSVFPAPRYRPRKFLYVPKIKRKIVSCLLWNMTGGFFTASFIAFTQSPTQSSTHQSQTHHTIKVSTHNSTHQFSTSIQPSTQTLQHTIKASTQQQMNSHERSHRHISTVHQHSHQCVAEHNIEMLFKD